MSFNPPTIKDPIAAAIRRSPRLRFGSKLFNGDIRSITDRASAAGMQVGLGGSFTGGGRGSAAEQNTNAAKLKTFMDHQGI